jgi:hypothetical protein
MPEKDYLKQFRYNLSTNQMETSPHRTAAERPPDGMPGGAISVSANYDKNGIVWANVPNANGQWFGPVGGHMVAFNAESLTIIYRDDEQVAFAKFNPPIAAAQHVIRPTFANKVIVYGLLPQRGRVIAGIREIQLIQPPGPLPDPAPIACYSAVDKLASYGGYATYEPVGEERKLDDAQGGTAREFAYSETLAGTCGAPQSVKVVAQQAAIYWSPKTCAHLVRGPVLSLWQQAGANKGELGYPITDELPLTEGGVHQFFERGEIVWTPVAGASIKGKQPPPR